MEDKKQQKTINSLYWLLIVSSVLSFVPSMAAQLFSLVMLTVILAAAYFYQARTEKDGLLYNHMTYMIRTIWIGSAFILTGMMAAGFWVYSSGDSTAIENAANQIMGGTMPSEEELNAICMKYLSDNKALIITSSLLFVGPGILYFVYRVANGISRAAKGYRIANPKSWL